MLETAAVVESNVGFSSHSSQLQSCGDSSEEELAVLPRHTKVVVTGNNRTKSVLVGLHGVVKKAVGLGGWHWLVLTNGIEVKLQRNALSVIEAPTGKEEDGDLEFEHMQWNNSSVDQSNECIVNLDYLTKHEGDLSLVIHKPKLRLQRDQCENFSYYSLVQKVDLSKLEMAALWRYSHHFNLVDANPNPSKEQLTDVVQRHFMSQQLDELQVICGFVQAAKRLRKVCK